MKKVRWVQDISRFHFQLLRLLAFLLVWIHWDACLHYGACALAGPHRQALDVYSCWHLCLLAWHQVST